MKSKPWALLLFAYMTLGIMADSSTYTSQAPPSLETFSTYEDMQRYFAQRNLRSLRHLDNPSDDTYISAFNYHNEQPDTAKDVIRQKRSDPPLPTEPKLLKFEVADAVEPSDEVKQLIREARKRELNSKNQDIQNQQQKQPQMKKEIIKKKTNVKSSRSSRNKRSSSLGEKKKFNENIRMIRFDESDAREPNEHMKAHFKRMRSMEMKQVHMGSQKIALQATESPHDTLDPMAIKNSKVRVVSKRRRVRRSAPQMIKFELHDALDPDESIKTLIRPTQMREGRSSNMPTEVQQNHTQTVAQLKEHPAESSTSEDNDQSNNESKRLYVYKEAPVPMKVKKSLNTLPQEVQKIITNIMKVNHGGKAYVKHIPQQQMNYGYLKSGYPLKTGQQTVVYGSKLLPTTGTTYLKYVQPQKVEQVQIQSVPVVEKVRYIYHPVLISGGHAHQQTHAFHQHQVAPENVQASLKPTAASVSQLSGMSHPIVVPETSHVSQQQHQAPTEIHHTYAADLSNVHNTETEQFNFRPSKPDPLMQAEDENKLDETEYGGLSKGYSAELPVEHYKYELFTPAGGRGDANAKSLREGTHQPLGEYHNEQDGSHNQSPVQIKIEYHAPVDPIKDNYKELQEFKELSALMGKSPEDQIHGLTYLLAKEMQNKLQSHRQQKIHDGNALMHRPQDNTSPILFHPGGGKDYQLSQSDFKTHSGSLIAMGKSKLYVPIVEKTTIAAAEAAKSEQNSAAMKLGAEAPTPSSYLEYKNANKHTGQKVVVEQVIHHPTVTHHGQKQYPSADAVNLKDSYGHGLHYGDDETYASKYAFGYRIRDFYTGNDFGHKQNRDLDGVTRGQYHILLPDGRIQNVIYHADDTGFHADVSFESGH